MSENLTELRTSSGRQRPGLYVSSRGQSQFKAVQGVQGVRVASSYFLSSWKIIPRILRSKALSGDSATAAV